MTSSSTIDSPDTNEARSNMSIASKIARSAANTGGSGVRLVYSTSPSWPFASSSSASSSNSTTDIAVLDSSFNPPSRAHLALLLSPPILTPFKPAYDSHLLLFSTQNADKGTGKPGDASLSQRISMMTLMAKDVERIQISQGRPPNVAVGLVDKPLIFAKSTLTWNLIREQQKKPSGTARLHWVVGFDTLYRVFQLKYYPSRQDFTEQCEQFFDEERTTFVCARRDPSSYPRLNSASRGDAREQARREEDKLLESDNVARWVKGGSVGMLDLDEQEAKMSSTKIRELLKDASKEDGEKKERLKELVPPSLVQYLMEEQVYKE